MFVGSAGEARAEHLSHPGAGAIAAGEIRIAACFLSPRFAQGHTNITAAILEISESCLTLDFYAERAEALDQQCFMLILWKNNGTRKGGETLSQILERNAGRGLGFDPKVHGGDLVAAVKHGLSESELLIELKRASLKCQRTRCGIGGRELVDDSDAHAESGEPQGQHQARRTFASD